MMDRLSFLFDGWLRDSDAPALYDRQNGWLDYGGLREKIAALALAFKAPQKRLVFCLADQSVAGVLGYLAAALSGHAIAMLDPAGKHEGRIAAYRPDFILAPAGFAPPPFYAVRPWGHSGYALYERDAPGAVPHEDLFLLLPTSGTTGGSKFVRLSYRNIAHNTAAIIESLGLDAAQRAFLHLPLSYSFGLSILHTQLAAGGSIVLTNLGMTGRDFWSLARNTESTLFPGVPYHYAMLARLGLDKINAPALKTFLQAGGRLDPGVALQLRAEIMPRGGTFFIMYGQTEAAPRMTCLAAHDRPEKICTVGTVLKDGEIAIEDGEIVYRGPNVMMGYAENRAGLAFGDSQQACLATGDVGELDEDGYLSVTGRKQRFAKLYGMRVALDDVEAMLAKIATVAVYESERIVIVTTARDAAVHRALTAEVSARTGMPPGWFKIRAVSQLPRLPNGKPDYRRLRSSEM